eukprot:354903-Chlamydomonas_euryale.AAC.24
MTLLKVCRRRWVEQLYVCGGGCEGKSPFVWLWWKDDLCGSGCGGGNLVGDWLWWEDDLCGRLAVVGGNLVWETGCGRTRRVGGTAGDAAADGDAEDSDGGGTGDGADARGYNYLLSMPIWSLTLERVQKLTAEADAQAAVVEELRAATNRAMWARDLDAFLEVWGRAGGEEGRKGRATNRAMWTRDLDALLEVGSGDIGGQDWGEDGSVEGERSQPTTSCYNSPVGEGEADDGAWVRV